MKNILLLIFSFLFTLSFAQNDIVKRNAIEKKLSLSEVELLEQYQGDYWQKQEQINYLVSTTNTPLSYISKEGNYNEVVDLYPNGSPMYYQTYNAKAGRLANLERVKQKIGFASLLSGRGVTIGIFDTASLFIQHNEFKDKVNKIYLMTQDIPSDESLSEKRKFQLAQQHATHVSGTILARGIHPEAKGLAPGVVTYSYNWKQDYEDIIHLANRDGVVSNHSYGTTMVNDSGALVIEKSLIGVYDWRAEGFDRATYLHPNLLPVISAGNNHKYYQLFGNSGSVYNNLAGIATAKNALLVGAIAQRGDYGDLNNVVIADFSSYGPTRDYRVKPDLVAKGVGLYSTINDYSKTEGQEIRTDSYTEESGTSMAAPVVSSVIALLQEWIKEDRKQFFRAATMKALLIHSAYPLNKIIDIKTNKIEYLGEGPNPIYGWGAIDMDRALDILLNTKTKKAYIIEDKLLDSTAVTYHIENEYRDNHIEITLAWTDPPNIFDYNFLNSEWSHKALVNDLDIRLFLKGREIIYPWALNKNMHTPKAVKKDNDVDNVEKIGKTNLPVGASTLRLSHKNGLVFGQQEYSIVISSKYPISLKREINTSSHLVEDNSQDNRGLISIWPNPVSEVLNVDYDENETIINDILLYDMNGRYIQAALKIENKRIYLNPFMSGRYILKFNTNRGMVNKGLIIKR